MQVVTAHSLRAAQKLWQHGLVAQVTAFFPTNSFSPTTPPHSDS